jgi:hypothetical protein
MAASGKDRHPVVKREEMDDPKENDNRNDHVENGETRPQPIDPTSIQTLKLSESLSIPPYILFLLTNIFDSFSDAHWTQAQALVSTFFVMFLEGDLKTALDSLIAILPAMKTLGTAEGDDEKWEVARRALVLVAISRLVKSGNPLEDWMRISVLMRVALEKLDKSMKKSDPAATISGKSGTDEGQMEKSSMDHEGLSGYKRWLREKDKIVKKIGVDKSQQTDPAEDDNEIPPVHLLEGLSEDLPRDIVLERLSETLFLPNSPHHSSDFGIVSSRSWDWSDLAHLKHETERMWRCASFDIILKYAGDALYKSETPSSSTSSALPSSSSALHEILSVFGSPLLFYLVSHGHTFPLHLIHDTAAYPPNWVHMSNYLEAPRIAEMMMFPTQNPITTFMDWTIAILRYAEMLDALFWHGKGPGGYLWRKVFGEYVQFAHASMRNLPASEFVKFIRFDTAWRYYCSRNQILVTHETQTRQLLLESFLTMKKTQILTENVDWLSPEAPYDRSYGFGTGAIGGIGARPQVLPPVSMPAATVNPSMPPSHVVSEVTPIQPSLQSTNTVVPSQPPASVIETENENTSNKRRRSPVIAPININTKMAPKQERESKRSRNSTSSSSTSLSSPIASSDTPTNSSDLDWSSSSSMMPTITVHGAKKQACFRWNTYEDCTHNGRHACRNLHTCFVCATPSNPMVPHRAIIHHPEMIRNRNIVRKFEERKRSGAIVVEDTSKSMSSSLSSRLGTKGGSGGRTRSTSSSLSETGSTSNHPTRTVSTSSATGTGGRRVVLASSASSSSTPSSLEISPSVKVNPSSLLFKVKIEDPEDEENDYMDYNEGETNEEDDEDAVSGTNGSGGAIRPYFF